MALRGLSMAKFLDIKRMIDLGLSDRQIAKSQQVRRTVISQVRKGEISEQDVGVVSLPAWTGMVNWEEVLKEIGSKHPLSLIWEGFAKERTSYSNFTKMVRTKFPQLKDTFVTLRDFDPGERAEVDYSGARVEWLDFGSGKIHRAQIFVGILGYSQLIFASASTNMKTASFLLSHRKMYEYFQGVPNVTVPDNTKTAVLKCHRYDPDKNPAYTTLSQHYETAIVPARPYRPKDKALVEGAVKIVMRLFRWRYRRHTFLSLHEINQALSIVIEEINNKKHSRFKVSRRDRFNELEKSALKPLPIQPFESFDIRMASVHPDGTLSVDFCYYSVPYQFKGQRLSVHVGENIIEIYSVSDRIAVHSRLRKHGARAILSEHMPENAKAYRDTTAQSLLSQSKFISQDLNELFEFLFQNNTLGNLRLAQGLLRIAHKEIRSSLDRKRSNKILSESIQTMKMFSRIRCAYFEELIGIHKTRRPQENRQIQRRPGNPMLRYNQLKKEESTHEPIINQKHDIRTETPWHAPCL
jgi:hypothetical protein